jgi:hypothetical protein
VQVVGIKHNHESLKHGSVGGCRWRTTLRPSDQRTPLKPLDRRWSLSKDTRDAPDWRRSSSLDAITGGYRRRHSCLMQSRPSRCSRLRRRTLTSPGAIARVSCSRSCLVLQEAVVDVQPPVAAVRTSCSYSRRQAPKP